MKQVISNPNGTAHAAQIDGIDLKGKDRNCRDQAVADRHEGTELGWFVTIMPKTEYKESLELVSMTEDVKNEAEVDMWSIKQRRS